VKGTKRANIRERFILNITHFNKKSLMNQFTDIFGLFFTEVFFYRPKRHSYSGDRHIYNNPGNDL